MNDVFEKRTTVHLAGEDVRLFWRWRGVIDYFERSGRSPDLIMDVFTKLDIPNDPHMNHSVKPLEHSFHNEIDPYDDDYDNGYFDRLEFQQNNTGLWDKPKPTGTILKTLGGSNFKYEGDVKKGTTITYGGCSIVSASQELYQQLLTTFSGQTILLKNPPMADDSPCYLRNWLLVNNHPRILKHYIPSILIKEGYAELVEGSTTELKIHAYEEKTN
ncbi:hypothetical protein A8F94_07435 [Bacillus sp. FJAT-27225]|uniref:hypothetical protein n=1 Tax=Bacillus sp. FJAT-27225 TaxID=1743144 RepID=UPI00080C2435|nr:hypothetical protein [Bacillus sp. FJAT-27225]OCA87679.1 hypothetical protein A8F94_07435 [Bacillus sp. FJAT-27225]